jgi:uncharacterized protein with FMN-binding domain
MSVRRSLVAAASTGFAAVVTLHVLSPGRTGALATTTTSQPTTGTTTLPSGVRSAVGPSEQFGYGVISVKVTVNGTQILAVSVASLQTAESYSQTIANDAVPILKSEVLSAQSANIQSISGASYTSAGFAQSLQGALSSLGL